MAMGQHMLRISTLPHLIHVSCSFFPQMDIEFIVFLAIMLHKAPAAFGLVTFLLHEGLERLRIRKHLMIFALAAPVMAVVTFLLLAWGNGSDPVDKVTLIPESYLRMNLNKVLTFFF